MLIITDGLPRGLGYLSIDNRNVEAPVKNRLFEADTYTCTHCEVVVIMNPERKRPRYKCRGCNHHICDNCAAIREAGTPCKTYRQVITEALEAAERQADSGKSIILP